MFRPLICSQREREGETQVSEKDSPEEGEERRQARMITRVTRIEKKEAKEETSKLQRDSVTQKERT